MVFLSTDKSNDKKEVAMEDKIWVLDVNPIDIRRVR